MIITALSSSLMVQYSLSYSFMEATQRDESSAASAVTGTSDQNSAPLIEPTDTSDEAESQQKLRGENGVLRLYQADHFKGNAEMRLREVFHRELCILGLEEEDPTVPGLEEEGMEPAE